MGSMESTPYPLGPTRYHDGINFALFAVGCERVELIFPDTNQTILLTNRLGDVWHIFVPLSEKTTRYFYRIDGIDTLDPFSPEVASSFVWGTFSSRFSQITDLSFNWEGITPPRHKKEELIIYEMHVRGFTQDPSSSVKHPGTFLGLIEKIPYLKELGINAVELLPITEFDETLGDYWGYSPISFFALMNRYGVENTALEFKLLVRELHRADIEVILDVVYNHTSVKEKSSYYSLAKEAYYVIDDGVYNNETGCGNTFRADHVIASELILRSLRFFAHEYQVDGFRFDLATILKRTSPTLVEAIADDPLLKQCKLIAEPWDPIRYEVGRFDPRQSRWSEWNDQFRDTTRQFMRGDPWKKGYLATRLSGSADLFGGWGNPASSLNFVTSHDGFSLRDLVSYNFKHNLANGENNRDGSDHNYSWNCGVEGPTDDPSILALRDRQMKNFLLALFLARGIPMLTMGDEYGHTKLGNNNTWCQDNPLSWFQWGHPPSEFVTTLIALRKTIKILTDNSFLTNDDIDWHTAWDHDDRLLAYTLKNTLFVAFNASSHPQTLPLPPGNWSLLLSSGGPTTTLEPHSARLYARSQ